MNSKNPKPQDQTQSENSRSTSQPKLLSLEDVQQLSNNLKTQLKSSTVEIDENSLTLKILDEKIRVKLRRLKTLHASEERVQHRLDSLEKFVQVKGEQKKSLKEDIVRVEASLKSTIADIKKQASARKFELNVQLKEIEDRVNERNDFYVEQERTRQESIASLTLEAEELNEHIIYLRDLVESLSLETTSRADILNKLDNEVSNTKLEFSKLKEKCDRDLKSLSDELAQRESEIETMKVNRDEILSEVNTKLSKLREYEEGLMARENALKDKDIDLSIRERRVHSAERLYS